MRPASTSSAADSAFHSDQPNCRATISRHWLCESEMFSAASESRRDRAIAFASLYVRMCPILHPRRSRVISACVTDPFAVRVKDQEMWKEVLSPYPARGASGGLHRPT